MTKVEAADIFIWCDRFQGVRHGWFNRNRLADGTPLLVPLDHRDWYGEIRDIRIGNDARWRRKLSKTLELNLGDVAGPYCDVISRPYGRVAALNVALLRQMCLDMDINTEWVFQSHLENGQGNPLRAHSDNPTELLDVSERIAAMVAEVGGTIWLSGASGRGYLSEEPFRERGITVEYHVHDGPNPCALELVRDRVTA